MNLSTEKQQLLEKSEDHSSITTVLLCIGDGDFSFSLALARCYPTIGIIATTIVMSESELILHYPNSAESILSEISSFQPRVQLLYGVDATHLDDNDAIRCILRDQYKDLRELSIVFNHPHLGYDSLGNEAEHAKRHFCLLAHYFSSSTKLALMVSNDNQYLIRTTIHVCLCGTQHTTWKLMNAAARAKLTLLHSSPVEKPLLPLVFYPSKVSEESAYCQKQWKAPRRFRNKSLGSVHWLSKYGYTPRKTRVDGRSMAVYDSINYVFSMNNTTTFIGNHNSIKTTCFAADSCWCCDICDLSFETKEELQQHIEAPSNSTVDIKEYKCPKTGRTYKSLYAMQTSWKNNNGNDNCSVGEPKLHTIPNEKKQRLDVTNTAKVLIAKTVSSEHDCKRLKWWARQSNAFGESLPSKAICEKAIKNGRIKVNGEPAFDSSRILHEGDLIELLDIGYDYNKDDEFCMDSATKSSDVSCSTCCLQENKQNDQTKSSISQIHVKHETSEIVVAWKPVGTRACGAFNGSLETEVARLLSSSSSDAGAVANNAEVIRLFPVSRLEKGCGGLCILAKSQSILNKLVLSNKVRIFHKFIALVHGKAPEEWEKQKDTAGIVVSLSEKNGQGTERFWSKSRKVFMTENDPNAAYEWHSEPVTACIERLEVEPIISHHNSNVTAATCNGTVGTTHYLSTLRITCEGRRGRLCSSICNYLRAHGLPVVGDRFSKREFALLPRHGRNILKSKLRIACYGIEIIDSNDEGINVHRYFEGDAEEFFLFNQKYSALYWSEKTKIEIDV